jgi:hypothetical protein
LGAYQRGQTIKLSVAFTDSAGAAANPGTVAVVVEKPDGTETTYTTPTVTNPSTGAFQLILTADQSGMWSYRWTGTTGTTVAIDEDKLHVYRSVF